MSRTTRAVATLLAACLSCAPSLGTPYDKAYAAAARAESAGRLSEALAGFEGAAGLAARRGDADQARWAAIDVLVRQGRTAEAVTQLDEMAARGPSERQAEAAYRAASLRIDRGDPERGWRELETVPRRFPTSGVAHVAVRRLVARADQRGAEAVAIELAELGRDLAGSPLEEMVSFAAAQHLEARGDLAGARVAYVRIAERWPYPQGAFFDDALWQASVIDEGQGHARAAIEDLEKLVAVRETTTLVGSYERRRYVPSILRIGALYRDRLGDSARARDAFHRLYADFAHSTMRDDALWLEAALWRRDGDTRTACDRLATLVREFPQSRYVPCVASSCPEVKVDARGGAPGACHPYIERQGWEPKAP